jgi:hypothetical protein
MLPLLLGVPISWPLINFVTLVAYASAAIFGVPAYLVFRSRVRPTLSAIMLTGGVVAAAPWVLLFLIEKVPQNASADVQVTYVNVRITWARLLSNVELVGMIFGLGIIGGIVFWLCVKRSSVRAQGQRA